ncbi:MAG: hypothetical protein KAJ08_00800, partial [Deltaproteobacteria bacterium]|nr:hypothetical protein [Deltaproteobacteria bacterium]
VTTSSKYQTQAYNNYNRNCSRTFTHLIPPLLFHKTLYTFGNLSQFFFGEFTGCHLKSPLSFS